MVEQKMATGSWYLCAETTAVSRQCLSGECGGVNYAEGMATNNKAKWGRRGDPEIEYTRYK